jgi:hypothetical protein
MILFKIFCAKIFLSLYKLCGVYSMSPTAGFLTFLGLIGMGIGWISLLWDFFRRFSNGR